MVVLCACTWSMASGMTGQNIYAKTEAGNCVVAPGLDEALCMSWMGDNAGPPPGRGVVPLDIDQVRFSPVQNVCNVESTLHSTQICVCGTSGCAGV